MKYQNIRAFQKHLESASPHHLSHCYFIAVPDDFERAKVLTEVRAYLAHHEFFSLNGPDATCFAIKEALMSQSLFGSDAVVLVDEADKMGKKDLQSLADFLKSVVFPGYLICGAKSKTILAPVCEKIGIILDLTDEKSWDKERRLVEQLVLRAEKAGKRLASDAVSLLLERVGPDAALLDCELDKLICYVGEKIVIERSDIFSIVGASRTHTLWQAAEVIVWERIFPPLEPGVFYGLIPALRSQFELGMKMASLVVSQTPREEWNVYFPKIWPKTLEKRSSEAVKMGAPYFQKGLELLFEIELLSRTGSVKEAVLLDFFRCSLGR